MTAKKILVVDDDPYILMSLEFLLQKNNYHVIVARNGREALELVKQERPDLVILDIMMPDVDGFAIARSIKQDPLIKNTKIVFLSAKSRESDQKKGMELGAALYIIKPFSTRSLIKEINQLLE
ncbi:response regulator [Flavihumibacter sp. CACIAM 22H1]|uniref:response regulator transcription factor n=1 Tax=Flavihumibacter sp. CACIAM 22H1 TaxID=1812911 RepID=UPI0007A8E70D|nr:response regulator [Flavihumibacter sp. CACIAM 22H1]KYP15706.1 MAG: transcriptional regulator [Flavihumibacter sp. CACIAM 22H1]